MVPNRHFESLIPHLHLHLHMCLRMQRRKAPTHSRATACTFTCTGACASTCTPTPHMELCSSPPPPPPGAGGGGGGGGLGPKGLCTRYGQTKFSLVNFVFSHDGHFGLGGGGGSSWGCKPNYILPPAMGYGCVCTTGTVRHKAEVQSKSQREKLFSDMSWAPFAAVGKQVQSMQYESTASKSYELNPGRMTYHRAQRNPPPPYGGV